MEKWDRPHRAGWLVGAAFCVLTLVMAAGGWFFFRRESASFTEAAHAALASIADLKVKQIVARHADRLGDADIITSDPGDGGPCPAVP